MSDGAFEQGCGVGVVVGVVVGVGALYLNNVSYVAPLQEQEARRLETRGRDVTWPQSHPSARGRGCQQPEALTAGNLFTNLTFDLNQDGREGTRRSATAERGRRAELQRNKSPTLF